mmetsp:Transcript_4188/g.5922  ORF Transcript_4188/g.5922 Transcript_4188/m.5922 type:complete len:85 (+) Transcript_4188:462-716(+)
MGDDAAGTLDVDYLFACRLVFHSTSSGKRILLWICGRTQSYTISCLAGTLHDKVFRTLLEAFVIRDARDDDDRHLSIHQVASRS